MNRVLTIVVIVLGSFSLLFIVTPLFLSSHYSVERRITIDAPPRQVYAYVVDLARWQAWSSWEDPEAEYTISSPSSGVGAEMSWRGEQVGQGRLSIEATEAPRMIRTQLEFAETEEPSQGHWRFTRLADGRTKVTWRMSGELGYFSRYFGLLLPDMIGEDFDKGLKNLKTVAEKRAQAQG
jgi:uncharacterized protein YndB with AHSA1/START domain